MTSEFRILVAIDGSSSAQAALRTALGFPWPEPSNARAVVALGSNSPRLGRPRLRRRFTAAVKRGLYAQTGLAERMLKRRWSSAQAFALHEPPAPAIFSEARRFGADSIVLGWRGHGGVRRLLAGSVSREVVGRASIPVLVARTALPAVRRVIVGFDGSPGARRALRFASRLEHRRGSQIVLASVIEPMPVPAAARLPAAIRATLRAEVATLNRQRAGVAKRKTGAAAGLLRAAGWAPRVDLRFGAALETLLGAAQERAGTVLIVGATSRGKLRNALLGSVAAGALNHSRAPVVIVP
jgi:nucleotide-binding universal stress UspA family protein